MGIFFYRSKKKGPTNKQTNKKKAKSWDEEVEDAWTQFQNYLNGSENIDSQVIMEFLNFSWQTKNMAVGSMVNLKVRLSLAYKKYTGWRKYDFGIQTTVKPCK